MTFVQEILLLLEQSGIFVERLQQTVAPAVMGAGMDLWRGLAAIMIVWYGTQMALRGSGVDMAGVIRLVIGLSIPLGMLQFYRTPLPGAGWSVPELITRMGPWLQGVIGGNTLDRVWQQVELAIGAWTGLFTRGQAGVGGVFMAVWRAVSDPMAVVDAVFDLAVTVVMMSITLLGLLAVFAIGQAQVMWAQIAVGVAVMLGPVFIPWIVVPPLSFLFWGWLRTLINYSLYAAVAAAVFQVVGEIGIFALQGWTGDFTPPAGVDAVNWTGPSGLTTAIRRMALTVPYVIAAGLAIFKVGELTQLLTSGAGNAASGMGQRVTQAASAARMAATGGL